MSSEERNDRKKKILADCLDKPKLNLVEWESNQGIGSETYKMAQGARIN